MSSQKTTCVTRRNALLSIFAVGLTGCQTDEVLEDVLAGIATPSGGAGLTQLDAANGIRAALENGTLAAVSRLGSIDGYLKDAIVHIALPDSLRDIQSTLRTVGLSGQLDDLEVQINRGAEAAAPVARQVFVNAITSMTIEDAIGIVRGPSNSATQYLERRTGTILTQKFTPIMTQALQNTGAIKTFDQLTGQLNSFPLAPQLGANAKQDLIHHGVKKGLSGIFYYIGKEEAAIRSDPAKRTSEILRRVFG
ncbi:MAG: DUF4197 domain-containing protein [bacterium]